MSYSHQNNILSTIVAFNLFATIVAEVIYLSYLDSDYYFSGGMALDFGDNPGEFIIADGDEIAILNINGTVLNEFELISVGFPDGGFTRGGSNDVGYVRSLERDANGDLYGLDEYGVLGRLDLENETFTYITEFTDGGDIVTLFKLPENIFQ